MRIYRILIVDDQRDARRVLRAGLETLPGNIHIVDVPSGEEAILVNSRQPFDLLVIDVRLPGISGFELIRHVRLRNPNLKIILITGVADPSVREQVTLTDAEAHFFKPVEMGEFLDAAKRCLNMEAEPVGQEDASTRPSAARISERLAGLRGSLRAHSALLVSERGEFVAQAGALPGDVEADALARAVMSVLNGVDKTARIAGMTFATDLVVITGERYDIALTHVGQAIGLLLIAAGGVFKSQGAGRVATEMQPAASDLLGLLSDIGVPVEPVKSTIQFSPVKPEETIAEAPALDLDRIFKQGKKVKATEANAFWESVVEENNAGATLRSDALSYDQARQLGLAPEES